MCLTIVSGPHIVEEDLIVYKTLFKEKERITSVYYPMIWEVDKVVPSIVLRPYNEEYRSLFGASYSITQIKEGYHAYRYLLDAKLWCLSREVIGEFIIPKGATYFIGSCNEIVSSDIRMVKILDI